MTITVTPPVHHSPKSIRAKSCLYRHLAAAVTSMATLIASAAAAAPAVAAPAAGPSPRTVAAMRPGAALASGARTLVRESSRQPTPSSSKNRIKIVSVVADPPLSADVESDLTVQIDYQLGGDGQGALTLGFNTGSPAGFTMLQPDTVVTPGSGSATLHGRITPVRWPAGERFVALVTLSALPHQLLWKPLATASKELRLAGGSGAKVRPAVVVLTPAVESQVRQVMQQWREAKVNQDVNALNALMSAYFVEVNQDGDRGRRERILHLFSTQDIDVTAIQLLTVNFKAVTGGIQATGTQIERVTYRGREVGGTLKFTELYVPGAHGFQIQSSRLERR
jgi:hypothetical protein